ncbi:DUF551 domain-containing protein [Enterobacter hormaechei]
MSTITKEFTKEQLQQIIETDHVQCGEASALARIALASLESEPVGEVSEQRDGLVMDGTVDLGGASTHRIIKGASKMKRLPLGTKFYTAPPAPVSVPDAMEMDDDFDSAFEHGKAVGWNAYRAAMLQGADGNSPVIPDGLRLALSNAGIAAPESDEMLAATCEKYIQALVTWVKERKPFRSAVIPDGWVACSEQMPEDEQEVIVQNKMGYRYVSYFDEHSGLFFDMRGGNQMNCIEHIFVTHWMPLPAAPQQEA